jgi:prophage DNA circulation protein
VRYFAVFALALLLCSTLFIPSVYAQGSAQAAINSAKDALKNCYTAVSEAEAAGANVDALMTTLNNAASSLSTAELAYASGDYDKAYNSAIQCQSKLNDFIPQANTLTANAQAASSQNFAFITFLSLLSLAVLGVGLGAWIVLSRREKRNIHGAGKI